MGQGAENVVAEADDALQPSQCRPDVPEVRRPPLAFVYAYMDDLLVTIGNAEKHKEHLALEFGHPDKCDVIIDPSRGGFVVPSLCFLGHHVDSECLRPLSSKVEAIRDCSH
nr:unnamed protein product [Spirometra erinaceieuropaei]